MNDNIRMQNKKKSVPVDDELFGFDAICYVLITIAIIIVAEPKRGIGDLVQGGILIWEISCTWLSTYSHQI